MRELPMGPDRIPDFRRLSDSLMQRTGWQVVAVPGLVPDEVFFGHLANRRFPAKPLHPQTAQAGLHRRAGCVPRRVRPCPDADEPGDCRLHPGLWRGRAAGAATGRAGQAGAGVLVHRQIRPGAAKDGLRIYGAGIASSASSVFALDDASPNRLRFDLARVMRLNYRIDDFQESYFVIDSLDALLALAQIDFHPLYARVQGQPDIAPGTRFDR